MRGSIWALFVTAIGAGLMLFVGVPAATPASGAAASSTNDVNSILSTLNSFAGILLLVAAVGALVTLAFRST